MPAVTIKCTNAALHPLKDRQMVIYRSHRWFHSNSVFEKFSNSCTSTCRLLLRNNKELLEISGEITQTNFFPIMQYDAFENGINTSIFLCMR